MLTNLKSLSLVNCNIDDALLIQMSLECKTLQTLNISNTNVTGTSAQHIFSNIPFINYHLDKGVSMLFLQLGNVLQTLILNGCVGITGECFRYEVKQIYLLKIDFE